MVVEMRTTARMKVIEMMELFVVLVAEGEEEEVGGRGLMVVMMAMTMTMTMTMDMTTFQPRGLAVYLLLLEEQERK